MNRRTFLALASSAAAAPLSSARPAKPVSVGAHLWMYAAKQQSYDPTPVLPRVFGELGKAGLDGLELMQNALLHDDAVPRIRELSERHALPIIGTSWSADLWNRAAHEAAIAEARTVITRVAALGGRTLGISVGDARRRKTPAELDAQAASLRAVFSVCRDHGVVPNLHNHVYEVRDGEYDLNGTLERLPEAKLGPDIGWLFRAKIDPLDFIRRHRARIIFAHLRNEKADGTWPEDLTEGVIDFAAVGRLLHETAFRGDLMIELAHEPAFQPTRPFGESVRLSRAYVQRVMNY